MKSNVIRNYRLLVVGKIKNTCKHIPIRIDMLNIIHAWIGTYISICVIWFDCYLKSLLFTNTGQLHELPGFYYIAKMSLVEFGDHKCTLDDIPSSLMIDID